MKIEKKYVVYGLVVIFLLVISASLAYFQTKIVGDKKNVTVTTKDLKIVYTDGDGVLSGSIEPGYTITKAFTVENKTGSTYEYNIVIKDLVNTFVTSGFLQYKITSDNGYNMTEYKDIPKSSTATDTVLAYSVSIEANTTHTYTLSIVYNDSETVDQSDDMGKTLSGKLYIGEGTEVPTLASAMLRDNPTISTRSSFSEVNTSNTTGTIYKTTSTEDGSEVYYYSGNTTNNWVLFGALYWRIIRTNEDGSVRLLYAGTSHDTTSGYISTSAFNSAYDESRYVGYMYGENTSLEDNRTNTTDSTILKYLSLLYQHSDLNVYDGTEGYISRTAIYCNDRSVSSGTWTNSDSTYFYYGGYTRLYSNKTPTYKCGGNTSGGLFESTQATQDKFSASTTGGGNGQLTYPIGLMTADEVSFAGGGYGLELSSSYAWYYTNSNGESITGSEMWWLITPYNWYYGMLGNTAFNFAVYGSGSPGDLSYAAVNKELALRPVISLNSCVKVTGTGTPTDPYVIDRINSACGGSQGTYDVSLD